MIQLLCDASRAGVRVDLLIRGICSLRPGVRGLSENIRVTSIVGRFLEHSRIYYFRNGGDEEIFLGSADLMPRNLNRRVEVLFPVTAPRLVARVRDEILKSYLADDACSRHMQHNGSYTAKRKESRFDSQAWFLGQRPEPVTSIDRRQKPAPPVVLPAAAAAAASAHAHVTVNIYHQAEPARTDVEYFVRSTSRQPEGEYERLSVAIEMLRESVASKAARFDTLTQRLREAHFARAVLRQRLP
jgi:hypothetical protein